MLKTSTILARARDILEERGWCQHAGMDASGRHCAAYGVVRAAEELEGYLELRSRSPVFFSAFHALHQAAFELGHASIATFNDHPCTTKQDVLNLFDKTIAKLEEKSE